MRFSVKVEGGEGEGGGTAAEKLTEGLKYPNYLAKMIFITFWD